MKKLFTLSLIIALYTSVYGISVSEFNINSTNGYSINIVASVTDVVIRSKNCDDGFTYDFEIEYDIVYSGNNIPSGMWTLQGNLICNGKKHWFGIPVNAKEKGKLVTTQNIWSHEKGCSNVELESFGCNEIEILIFGPGISSQTVVGNSRKLPIVLESFSAAKAGKTIEVKWSTFSEKDNDFFTLEKSTDGETFKEIHTIKGKGTTVNRSEYFFMDESPGHGHNYYRLKQTDFDGSHELFNIIMVSYAAPGDLLKVYPNPFTDVVNIDIPVPSEVSILISDARGSVVYSKTHFGTKIEIDTQILTKGLYVATVKDMSGRVIHSGRIVK